MKKQSIKFFDKIIVTLLGFLGLFNSCDYNKDEYGSPSADYELKGIIIDKETSKPIENIQVVLQKYSDYRDTVFTDIQGKYELQSGLLENKTCYLKIEDIDGEDNGGDFASQEMEIKFTKDDQVKKGSGWYEGKYVKTQNIELKKK
jgi:putative lipoprotein (rSAM/lipoprotein system)